MNCVKYTNILQCITCEPVIVTDVDNY